MRYFTAYFVSPYFGDDAASGGVGAAFRGGFIANVGSMMGAG